MSEWKEVKLGDVCDVITKGTTPSNIGDSFVDEGIKFIRSEMLGRDKYINNSGFLFISEETHQRLRRSQLKEKDILFSMAGVYLGKTAILRKEDVPSNTNQAVAIIRVNGTKADVEYIYYCLNHPHIVKTVNASCAQSAQPNINLKQIGEISFLTPPLGIQQRIASILSSLDDKIAVNKKICENLEAQAQAMFKHWFVDFAPFKDGKFVESELGLIPEGWRVGTLGEICTTNKRTLSSKNIPDVIEYLDTGNITANRIDNIQLLYKGQDKIPSRAKRLVSEGDIIYSTVRPNQRHYGILPNPSDSLVVSTGFVVITANWSGYRYFIYNFLIQNAVVETLQAIGEQSVSTYPSINASDIESLRVIIPKMEDVDKFAEICCNIYCDIDNLEKESIRLATLRDTLLPKLMSREIKV